MRNTPEYEAFIGTVNALVALKNAAADRGDWAAAGAIAFEYRNVIDRYTTPDGFAAAIARAEELAAR